MKKWFFTSLALVIVCSGVISYLYVSNDHSECNSTLVTTYGENAETITTETHVCKEKFNL